MGKGSEGTDNRTYPWGESEPDFNKANFGREFNDKVIYVKLLKPVGSYEQGKSPSGVYDMAGNVWEWMADWYSSDYYKQSPGQNPKGPSRGKFKVLRGGSYEVHSPFLRSASRLDYDPTTQDAAFGFRCAKNAERQ